MKKYEKYDLLWSGESIIRVWDVQQERVLVIDCINRRMPAWVEISGVESYSECFGCELSEVMGVDIVYVDALDAEQKKVMYERYTMIASVLPFVGDEKMRSKMILSMAVEHEVSKQTIRNYLCLYLVCLDVAILAPKKRQNERELTKDEKNIRWALNKFFYTTAKQSLHTAYTMMLKEKYCDSLGVLMKEYPSFYQFLYFYRKTRKMQNFYISRDGLKNYQRNNRPLTGEGVQGAPAIGVGMLDATVCDIYLINDAGNLAGRPILTVCIDAYSSLGCGYSLSWEGDSAMKKCLPIIFAALLTLSVLTGCAGRNLSSEQNNVAMQSNESTMSQPITSITGASSPIVSPDASAAYEKLIAYKTKDYG